MNPSHYKNGVMIEKISDSVFIVRGYADGKSFPDPYEWVAVAAVCGESVEFKALLHINGGKGNIKQAREVYAYFNGLGCTEIIYERSIGGKLYQVKRKL